MADFKEWITFLVRAEILTGVVYFAFLGALLYLFVRLHRGTNGFKVELAFVDSDGNASIARILNAIGGLTGTWLVVAMQLTNQTRWEIVGGYFAYMAGVYGLNKWGERSPPSQ